MEELISIIVPIYYSERTLDRCIKSLVKQTYKKIEIILVNDGSNDKSEEICKKWAKEDGRIKYFFKENSGAGDTRNYGLKKAKGKYIGFVDSDDEVLPNMYENLHNVMNKFNVKVAGCNNFLSNGENKIERKLDYKTGYIDGKKLIVDILYQTSNAWGAVWNKLYTKDVFNDIKFSHTSVMEDYLVSIKVFNEKDIYFLNEPLYIHYENENSLTHRKFNNSMLKGFETINEIEYYIEEKLDKKIYIQGCNYLKLDLCSFICSTIYTSTYKKENFFIMKKIKKYVNKHIAVYIGNLRMVNSLKKILKINCCYFLYKKRFDGDVSI